MKCVFNYTLAYTVQEQVAGPVSPFMSYCMACCCFLCNYQSAPRNITEEPRSHWLRQKPEIPLSWHFPTHTAGPWACCVINKVFKAQSLFIPILASGISIFSPTQCIYVFCVDLRTDIISLYSINWLIFITEESVYCSVRAEFTCNVILTFQSPVVTICVTSLTFNNPAFCPHSVFMCFVWNWEQTAIISLY